MSIDLSKKLKNDPITASAPCRIDLGGTLDIKTIYLPLRHLSPCTFNIALDMRTSVTLRSYKAGKIKVSSRGFEDTILPVEAIGFDHPLGLIFGIAAYFNVSGVHIAIQSASPPRSALGGSSVAAVALVAALSRATGQADLFSRTAMACTAHGIEEGLAGIPCGIQDQLAAAYGGMNAWFWQPTPENPLAFERKDLLSGGAPLALEDHFLVAYCGVPHASADINGRWIKHFLAGHDPKLWHDIVACAGAFVDALAASDLEQAQNLMNREVTLRKRMTPDVFNDMGESLVDCAVNTNCSARFTGAGGGGCIWALGQPDDIAALKKKWQAILETDPDACLLETGMDRNGVQ
ncbi:MAG: galactokinase [Thermodesulfobacteriota bacterium]|nr:galactokinase [Thermodesulfobacteriota bacterium]